MGATEAGVSEPEDGLREDRSDSQGKGLWLERARCCQETEKMPQRHEGRRQERDVLDGWS